MIRKFMALAYLRVEDVPTGREIVIQESARAISAHPLLQSFVNYFDRQWMPILNIWNIHDLADRATNNDLEGWHQVLNKRLINAGRNLPFWRFVKGLGEEALKDLVEYNQLLSGLAVSRVSSVSSHADSQITRMKGVYDRGEFGFTSEDHISGFIDGLLNNY